MISERIDKQGWKEDYSKQEGIQASVCMPVCLHWHTGNSGGLWVVGGGVHVIGNLRWYMWVYPL